MTEEDRDALVRRMREGREEADHLPQRRTDKPRHSVALWAGLTTLFVNIAAINVVALIGEESNAGATALAALITAVFTAAGVYAKQRWDEEKAVQAAREK